MTPKRRVSRNARSAERTADCGASEKEKTIFGGYKFGYGKDIGQKRARI